MAVSAVCVFATPLYYSIAFIIATEHAMRIAEVPLLLVALSGFSGTAILVHITDVRKLRGSRLQRALALIEGCCDQLENTSKLTEGQKIFLPLERYFDKEVVSLFLVLRELFPELRATFDEEQEEHALRLGDHRTRICQWKDFAKRKIDRSARSVGRNAA